MDIVLGVSMTPTTVRMVLVEGERADGATVDHDVFDISRIEGAATSSAPQQVIAAILGTQESAVDMGHRLLATGVTWSDHAEAAALRDALAGRALGDVTLFSELHAAGALAQAAGRLVGHDKTALVFIERDTATVSVVDTADGSIVKVDSRSLHSADAMAVLTEMVTSVEEGPARPEGIFLLGSGVDVGSLKEHLKNHVTIPMSAPQNSDMALARGAALAAANVPSFEPTTAGLAYSQDPDGTTARHGEALHVAGSGGTSPDDAVADVDSPEIKEHRKPFLLAGSSLTAIFAVGVVALVISLAVNIRPTVDTRPDPGKEAAGSSNTGPPPAAVQNAPAVQPPASPPPAETPPVQPPAVQPPAAETIPEPLPVVQQQSAPRAAVIQAPAPQPAAAAPAPAAVAPPPPAVEPPAPAIAPLPAPAPVAPALAPFGPATAAGPAFVPAPAAPVLPILPPFIYLGPAPSYRPPVREYDPRWYPPPQQQWPQGPPLQGPQQSPADSGYGPGSFLPRGGRGDSESPRPRGRSPLWPWPGD